MNGVVLDGRCNMLIHFWVYADYSSERVRTSGYSDYSMQFDVLWSVLFVSHQKAFVVDVTAWKLARVKK